MEWHKVEIFTNSMVEQLTVHRDVCDSDHLAMVMDFLSGYFPHPPEDTPAPFDGTDFVSPVIRLTLVGHGHGEDRDVYKRQR